MNRCRSIFARRAVAATMIVAGLAVAESGSAAAQMAQWSVSLDLANTSEPQAPTTMLGNYGVTIPGQYSAGLWAAELMDGLTLPSVARTSGNYSVSALQLSAALRGAGSIDPPGTDVALRWGTQLSDNLRVAVGPTVTVGRRDGLQLGVTPSGALPFGTRPGEAGPGLRGFGLEGSAAYRVGGNWALLGVMGYRRPVDDPTTPSNSFFSMLGIGYRF